MKKSKKLVTVVVLCLIVATFCSFSAYARVILWPCPYCGGDMPMYTTSKLVGLETGATCAHYSHGTDDNYIYEDFYTGTCMSCGKTYSESISDRYSVLKECHGYN
jgi:hypothetical protein